MGPRGTVLAFVLAFSVTAEAATSSARSAIALPVPAATIAETLAFPTADRSRMLLYAVRLMFDPDGAAPAGGAGARLATLLRTSKRGTYETVPLPLTPKIWRETILEAPGEETDVIAGIFASRTAALMFYGLSAMDDETLLWLAQRRDVLVHLTKHPGAFASFGRSVRIAGGRMVVPGGADAEPLWRAIVGANPDEPSPFVKGLFRSDRGRLAFFYDTVAHLDAPRQRFALQATKPDRLRALAGVFESFARDWDAEARPFTRPQLDPMLLLEAIHVTADGTLAGPADEAVWSRIYRDDVSNDVAFREVEPWKTSGEPQRADAAWLAAKIHLVPYYIGRRRLDTLAFTQRAFAKAGAEPAVVVTVARAFLGMPALMLTLERMHMDPVAVMLPAARHAAALNGIPAAGARELALTLFQSALGFVERGERARALSREQAHDLIVSLSALRIDDGQGYDRRIAEWLRTSLFRVSPQPPLDASDPVEMAVLSLIAGARDGRASPLVDWEGHRYRVDPAAAELARLQRVREQQGGLTLDAAITQLHAAKPASDDALRAQRELAQTVASILYAAHLGDPDGPAVAAGNVALKHDFGGGPTQAGHQTLSAWRLPVELFDRGRGWHVRGSLLGLDVALRSLLLRRLDPARLPAGPKVPLLERQIATMTVGLLNPYTVRDGDRDRIADALARGATRVEALKRDPTQVDAVASDAGLGEWRRESLRWALAHAPDEVSGYFNPLELLWLGAPSLEALDDWGGPALPLTGCICLGMPRPSPWENLGGRPSSGLLATRAVDAQLKIAAVLARMKLPASLAPAVLAYAMQDVLDDSQPAYLDDWQAFGAAANALSTERIVDYIAALTAAGPLVPVSTSAAGRH